MIFDTDILIWFERGHAKAKAWLENAPTRYLSVQTYMEFLQGARNKQEQHYIKDLISTCQMVILPFSQNIGHRASIYIEDHSLSSSLRAGDAIVAATAVEHNMVLATSNQKHFKVIKELQLKLFKP